MPRVRLQRACIGARQLSRHICRKFTHREAGRRFQSGSTTLVALHETAQCERWWRARNRSRCARPGSAQGPPRVAAGHRAAGASPRPPSVPMPVTPAADEAKAPVEKVHVGNCGNVHSRIGSNRGARHSESPMWIESPIALCQDQEN